MIHTSTTAAATLPPAITKGMKNTNIQNAPQLVMQVLKNVRTYATVSGRCICNFNTIQEQQSNEEVTVEARVRGPNTMICRQLRRAALMREQVLGSFASFI